MSSQHDLLSLTALQQLPVSTLDGDPWNWSVEKVIEFVSHLPIMYDELAKFTGSLSQHGINGQVLLTAVDYELLEKTLKVQILGNRVMIINMIIHLQSCSSQFWTHHERTSLVEKILKTCPNEVIIKDENGRSRRRLQPKPQIKTPNPPEGNEPRLLDFTEERSAGQKLDAGLEYLLQKYPPGGVGDKVLPVWGESRKDYLTEKELAELEEKEKKEQEREIAQKNKKSETELNSREKEVVIQDAITKMITTWKVETLPEMKAIAWEMWTSSKSNNDTKEWLNDLANTIKSLTKRRDKLRSEIADQPWTNANSLKTQCRILETTVEDLETCQWSSQLLQQSDPPEQVLPPPQMPQEGLQREEKHNESEKNGGEGSDGESLDGYDFSDDDASTEDGNEIPQEDLEVDSVTSATREYNELHVPQEQSDALENSHPTIEDGVTANLKRGRAASDLELGLDRGSKKAKANVLAISDDSNTTNDNIIDMESSEEDPILGTVETSTRSVESKEYASMTDTFQPELNRNSFQTPTERPTKVPDSEPKSVLMQKSLPQNKSDTQHDKFAVGPVDDTGVDPSAEKKAVDPFVDPAAQARMKMGLEAPLPPLLEVNKIHHLECDIIVRKQDRNCLITWIISHTPSESRLEITKRIFCINISTNRRKVWRCLEALKKNPAKMGRWASSEEDPDSLLRLTSWFVSYCVCQRFFPATGIPPACIDVALGHHVTFQTFHDLLKRQLAYFVRVSDGQLIDLRQKKTQGQGEHQA